MKQRCRLSLLYPGLLLLANGAYSAVYNWNTTTGNWDTSTANWTGAGTVWVDGNDAVFSNTATASVITLPGTISANSLMFGNGTNNGNFTLSGGTLNTSGNIVVQGLNTNGATYSGNPTVSVNSTAATVVIPASSSTWAPRMVFTKPVSFSSFLMKAT